ncbi:MAG: hypothetical protein GY820_38055 [Gammaproteobacteria bacterium]|nr:hypothetical protein [Gammaproteobacteria bacterium]
MKKLIAILLFEISVSVNAAELIPVKDSPYNLCKPYGCMYYEWEFSTKSNLRYIAAGYEDGIDYEIAEIDENGKLQTLLHVNPVVKDLNGNYWWGYPWSTMDIPVEVKNGEIYFYAYFEHEIFRDGVLSAPKWQKRMPALLLHSNNDKKVAKMDVYKYKLYTIAELISMSKIANKAVKHAPVGRWDRHKAPAPYL